MEWYSFSPTTDEKICGAYTQTDGMGPGYNLRGNNSVWNIPNLRKPNFEPDFDCFMLDKKAKLTDIISTSTINACGFIVSDKLKNLFDNFKLPPHIYYPVVLLHKKERITNYYWLHFTEDNTKYIDFDNSEFIRRDPLFVNDFERLNIKNEEDLISERKKSNLKHIFPSKLRLLNKGDLLVFGVFWNKFFINSLLAQNIEKGSTGVSTAKVNFIL